MHYGTTSPDKNHMEHITGPGAEGGMGEIWQGKMRARQWSCGLA